MNTVRLPLWIFLAALIGGCVGCQTKTPNPLAGWHAASKGLDPSIINDYQNYIQKFSTEDRNAGGYTEYFEDGKGQHAIKIIIGINGTVWEHVLIYDKNGKRIKTIKYANGGYRS